MKQKKSLSKSKKAPQTTSKKAPGDLRRSSKVQANFLQPPVAKLEAYPEFLEAIKTKIRQSQQQASLAVNSQLVLLYWDIGTAILSKQSEKGWGSRVITSLAMDLRRAFPGMTGFSPRNLGYMRRFSDAYHDRSFVESTLCNLPWAHNILILEKVSKPETRLWYTQQTIEHGWSKSILLIQIENQVHKRHGKALTNFKASLPDPHSDLA